MVRNDTSNSYLDPIATEQVLLMCQEEVDSLHNIWYLIAVNSENTDMVKQAAQ